MGVELWIVLRDIKGGTVKAKKSRSFVIQYLAIFISHRFYPDTPSVVDLNGATYDLKAGAHQMYMIGDVGDGWKGILVGTGTTPVTNTDYRLEAKIDEGTGVGQLQHGAMSYSDPVEVAGNIDHKMSRTFSNASGADITFNEVGIYARCTDVGGVHRHMMVARDLLTYTIPAGGSVSVEYIWRTTA